MDSLGTTAAAPQESCVAFQVLFFLRFIQLGSTVLTGFIACYLVWWHDVLHDEVPLGLIVVIFSCSLAFLESYISSAYALSRRERSPNYRLLRVTTTLSSTAMVLGYWSLRQIPFVQRWCEGDNWFRPVSYYAKASGVEEHHCALICDIIVAGAIAVAFTTFLAIFAIGGAIMEKRRKFVKLEHVPHEYTDNLLAGHGGMEKEVAFINAA